MSLSLGPLSSRYPDTSIKVLDDSFQKYRVFNASVERLAAGFRWLEGPVWFADGRYLLVSDIPNNRILRWDDTSGVLSVFREPANFANGNSRDTLGRLITCEGGFRRVTRTEHNGSISLVADSYRGKPLNSPNDIVCQSNGAVWFTDPPFQIQSNYEGRMAQQEIEAGVYRIDPKSSELECMLSDVPGPNGLCFSPDEKTLYVVASRAKPHRQVLAYDLLADGRLGTARVHIDARGPGALDGIRCDAEGNIWAGWGVDGSSKEAAELYDGVMVFNPQGKAIGHIQLPERCANLCFGGAMGNRLFMASSHSLYALYVNTQSAELR